MGAHKPRVFVVICAYGLWGTLDRTPKELVGYGMYLDSCLRAILNLEAIGHEVVVIPCGGATQGSLTEADTMVTYFQERIESAPVDFEPDRLSLTTPANLAQARAIIGAREGSILVACDIPRGLKVRWLAKRLFRGRQYEVIAFLRPDITPKSTRLFQFIEILCLAAIPGFLDKRIKKIRQ